MDLTGLRVLELQQSIPLGIISIIIIAGILIKFFQYKRYIPLILSVYGGIYCWLIVFVFGEGYSGIIFTLLSWVFIFTGIISLIYVIVSLFPKNVKGEMNS